MEEEAAARTALQRLVEERGEDYAGLSRLIGRNPAYIQQYIKRGTPRRLAERDRRRLAAYLQVDEALLGAPPHADGPTPPPLRAVPRLDLSAAAGGGAFTDGERALAPIGFDPALLRALASGDPALLSIIRVEGDSMAPKLGHGDEIMVDRGDAAERLRDGIYVLRLEGALLVKRIAVAPGRRSVSVRSDNPLYPPLPDCRPADLDLVGRVVWLGRRLA
jgi:phage repressor protein C with HTH and peptisase S24 domain